MALNELFDREVARLLAQRFEDEYDIDNLSDSEEAALELCSFCVEKNLPIKSSLWLPLANLRCFFFEEGATEIHVQSLRLAFHPPDSFYEYSACVVTTARQYGFLRIDDGPFSNYSPKFVNDLLRDDGRILNFGHAMDFLFDGDEVLEKAVESDLMLEYIAYVLCLIIEALRGPTQYDVREDMREKADRFLSCFGIVESYRRCLIRDESIKELVTLYPIPYKPESLYRHIAERILQAYQAARVIQLRWRKYKRVLRQNGVRALHMINKYACMATIPTELVQKIALMM